MLENDCRSFPGVRPRQVVEGREAFTLGQLRFQRSRLPDKGEVRGRKRPSRPHVAGFCILTNIFSPLLLSPPLLFHRALVVCRSSKTQGKLKNLNKN